MRRVSAQAHRLRVGMYRPEVRRWHARRCGVCNAMANPAPLSIDGDVYRRRRRARARRNR